MCSLALFDFDGTITSKDSLKEFILFTKGRLNYYLGLIWLSPVILSYFFGLTSRHRIKESLFTYFFGGMEAEVFIEKSHQFIYQVAPEMVRKQAMERIDFHRTNGDRIVIISASPESWVKVWATQNGCETIATRLEIKKGKITGKITGRNCQGFEKVKRIKSYLDLKEYGVIYTYGDTPGDMHFLKLGKLVFYKPFRR